MAVGWGRGTWGQGTWGEPVEVDVTVTLTGLAGTSALGTESVSAGATVAVTGLAGTGSVGTVVATGAAIVTETGVAGTTALGTETVTGVQYRQGCGWCPWIYNICPPEYCTHSHGCRNAPPIHSRSVVK